MKHFSTFSFLLLHSVLDMEPVEMAKSFFFFLSKNIFAKVFQAQQCIGFSSTFTEGWKRRAKHAIFQ